MKLWKRMSNKDTDLNFSDAISKQIGNNDRDLNFSDVDLTKAGFENVNLTNANLSNEQIAQEFADAVESLSNESTRLEL